MNNDEEIPDTRYLLNHGGRFHDEAAHHLGRLLLAGHQASHHNLTSPAI